MTVVQLDLSIRELKDSVKIFKLLSDLSRVKILWFLLKQPVTCVSEIAESLSFTQSNVSHHLSKLELMDFVTRKKEGRNVYYRVTDPCVIDILRRAKEHVSE